MARREPASVFARHLLTFAALSLCASAFSLTACQGDAPHGAAPGAQGPQGGPGKPGGPGGMPAAKVKLVTLQTQPVSESSEFLAEINSRKSVTLYAQASGYVRGVFVKPGDKVKAGAPIVQVDPSTLQAQVANLESIRSSRKAAVAAAEDRYQRAAKLAPAGVVSAQELEQAQAGLDAARADLRAAEAAVDAQQVQLGYSRVTAPFDGVVSDVPVKVGQLISPQTPVTLLNQAGAALEAYVSVPVSLAARLGPDTVVQLLDNDGKPLAQSKVDFISPDVKPATQTVLVRAVLPETPSLRFAQYVRARVIYGTHQGVLVPAESVVRRSGQNFIYVAAQNEGKLMAQQRPVRVGTMVGNDFEVLEGLKPGEQVVVSGVQNVRNGAPLNPEAG